MGIELNVISLQVCVELLRPKDLRNLHQLVVVVVTVEERLLPEDL